MAKGKGFYGLDTWVKKLLFTKTGNLVVVHSMVGDDKLEMG